MDWNELVIGIAGIVIGGIARYEIDSFLGRKYRREQWQMQKDQLRLLTEIYEELTPKG